MQQQIEHEMRNKLHQLEKKHLQNLQDIEDFVLMQPGGKQIDEDGTAEMKVKHRQCEVMAYNATGLGVMAFERLLHLIETRRSGQIERTAEFLAWAWGAEPSLKREFLMSLDRQIADDMVAVLEAMRWNRWSVPDLAVNARSRVPQALQQWGYDT